MKLDTGQQFKDPYRPHIDTGGGMPSGYKFMTCPQCGKQGVSSRVISHKIIRKVCKFCGWMESVNKSKGV